MNFATLRRLAPIAICAAALAAGTAAKADIQWIVTGTFDDGAKLSGYFDINMYGQFSDFDLKTSGGTVVGPQEYVFGATDLSSWSAPNYIEFSPSYQGDLHIGFALDTSIAAATNDILTSAPTPGPSFECIHSWSCEGIVTGGTAPDGATHYLTDGFATGSVIADVNDGGNGNGGGNAVPEPAAWALMIMGFGMAGGLLRARRRTALA
jgi:hypothetical protein